MEQKHDIGLLYSKVPSCAFCLCLSWHCITYHIISHLTTANIFTHWISKVNKNQIFNLEQWCIIKCEIYPQYTNGIAHNLTVWKLNSSKRMELLLLFSFLICLPLFSCQSYSVIPIITTQPRDQTVTRGSVAYFSCRSKGIMWVPLNECFCDQILDPLAIDQHNILVQEWTRASKCEGVKINVI